ncbi:MAG: HAD family hydrolase [Bacteriovoracaceae bacterium]|nr:HAD family hydrolase [Bacteriovoracaceae bacterium]
MKLISFDADQTLIDFFAIRDSALEAVAFEINKKYPSANISKDDLTKTRDQIAKRYEEKQIAMLTLREMSFIKILDDVGGYNQSFVQELMELFKKKRFNNIVFYPETLEVLKKIKFRYKTALITNGNSDPSQMGFGKYFDIIILGEHYPYKKPDKRIFRQLLKLASVNPEDVVHIGDSIENDVRGANDMGMTSVWINRLTKENKTNHHPTHEINCLTELLPILQ